MHLYSVPSLVKTGIREVTKMMCHIPDENIPAFSTTSHNHLSDSSENSTRRHLLFICQVSSKLIQFPREYVYVKMSTWSWQYIQRWTHRKTELPELLCLEMYT